MTPKTHPLSGGLRPRLEKGAGGRSITLGAARGFRVDAARPIFQPKREARTLPPEKDGTRSIGELDVLEALRNQPSGAVLVAFAVVLAGWARRFESSALMLKCFEVWLGRTEGPGDLNL